jgi:hypothetical protein
LSTSKYHLRLPGVIFVQDQHVRDEAALGPQPGELLGALGRAG